MKALSIHSLIIRKFSLRRLAHLLFHISDEDHSTLSLGENDTNQDVWSDLNFFKDEGELEDYLQSFRNRD